jgi:hypothetical protein
MNERVLDSYMGCPGGQDDHEWEFFSIIKEDPILVILSGKESLKMIANQPPSRMKKAASVIK